MFKHLDYKNPALQIEMQNFRAALFNKELSIEYLLTNLYYEHLNIKQYLFGRSSTEKDIRQLELDLDIPNKGK